MVKIRDRHSEPDRASPFFSQLLQPDRLGLEKIGPGKIYPNYGAHSDKLTLSLHDSNEKFHFQT